jgi:ribonuclease HI
MSANEFQDLVYIYADESCLGNQFSDRATPGAAAGLVEVFDARRGWTRRDYFVSEPDTTNNRMALRSAIEGLRALRRACRITFSSDSNYLIRGAKEWIHNWARRGWTRKTGPVENLELWFELVRAWQRHTVQWHWVRGHAGHPQNEYVNDLAVRSARSQKNSRGLVGSEFATWIEAQQEKGRYLEFFDPRPEAPFKADRRPPPLPHNAG